MEASKITFSQETRFKLDNPVLSHRKKQELRKQRIKEFIESKPAGTRFSMQDLIFAAGYDASDTNGRHYANGNAFVKRLMKKGFIKTDRIGIERRFLAWTSSSSVPTFILPESRLDTTVQERPVEEVEERQENKKSNNDTSFVNLAEAKAIEFAWKYNNDSLREFIKYIKEK